MLVLEVYDRLNPPRKVTQMELLIGAVGVVGILQSPTYEFLDIDDCYHRSVGHFFVRVYFLEPFF